MNASSTWILRFCLVALCAAALGACAVTGPDESAWQDVSAFSWRTSAGLKMRYKVETYGFNTTDTTYRSVSAEASDATYHGQAMFVLNDSVVSYPNRVRFLPLHDTLVTQQESFGATYALVAPLEKNHTWVSAYSDAAQTQPLWHATIIERFSQMVLEGRVYNNVLVVKYEPPATQLDKGIWIRYYAQGIGPIETVKKLPPQTSTDQTQLQPVQRTVLVGSEGS